MSHSLIGLSLDGGGVRGLLLSSQLEYLEKEVGYPLHQIFDYVGGTSIGGILALGCTGSLDGVRPVCTASELSSIIEVNGKDIFHKTQIQQLKSLFQAKYDPAGIESVLLKYFRDAKLSEVLRTTNVLVTAVNRIDNQSVIFKSSEASLWMEKDFYLRDIGRATSAAPTFFPSAEIKNIQGAQKLSLLDGGVCINNPAQLVLDEVQKMAFTVSRDFFLLSLGTGSLVVDAVPENAGLLNVLPIIDSLNDSPNNHAIRDLMNMHPGRILRISPALDLAKRNAELDNTDSEVLAQYRQIGARSAAANFTHRMIYGQFRNKNFVEWLRENTEKKI